MFSIPITYHSKIRELSDRNKNWKQKPNRLVYEDGLKIMAFQEDGKPCYEGKSSSGHIWWDICNCADCQEEEAFEEDYSRRKKKIFPADTQRKI